MKEFIKNRLNEHFAMDLLEDMMMGEAYPSKFNLEEFNALKTFNDRIYYCDTNLRKISSGSGRVVYMIDDEKVLKLSKNQKGVAQTETEAEWGQIPSFSKILAHTFEFDEQFLWIEMELARKVTNSDFTQLTGCFITNMFHYLSNEYAIDNGRKALWGQAPEVVEKLQNNEFVQSVLTFMKDTGSPLGDYGQLSSYGIVKRNGQDTVVIIDFGLTNDIYNTYYS